MAQEVIYNPGDCVEFYRKANCQNKGPGKSLYRQLSAPVFYGDQVYQDQSSTGWKPIGIRPIGIARGKTATTAGATIADLARRFVAAGGTAGTAPAIAANPIGGDEYARRNGFVCIPGTWFRGEDGWRHFCQ